MKESDRLITKNWIENIVLSGPIKTIFDVGSNRGQFAKRVAQFVPEALIYAFEPCLAAFSELEKIAESGHLIRPFNTACGSHDGTTTIHENSNDVTNSLLENSATIHDYAPESMCTPVGSSRVSITRLDTFCAEQGIDTIDLLKIDSQGFEGAILKGCGNLLDPRFVRALQLEVLFVDLYQGQSWCGEILEKMRAHGYELFSFIDISSDDQHGWKWADALFLPARGK